MKKNGFLYSLIVMVSAVFILSGCAKDDSIEGYATGNPMPGTWNAKKVNWQGYTVDIQAKIGNEFGESEGIYYMVGDSIGCMEVDYEGQLFDSATIISCLYNSVTHTGEFTLHYAGDDDETYYQEKFYYDAKFDRFTVISIDFNVTFTR